MITADKIEELKEEVLLTPYTVMPVFNNGVVTVSREATNVVGFPPERIRRQVGKRALPNPQHIHGDPDLTVPDGQHASNF